MDDIRKGKPIKRTRRRKLRDLGDLDGLFQTFITIKTAEGKAKGTLQQYRDNYKSDLRKRRAPNRPQNNRATAVRNLRTIF